MTITQGERLDYLQKAIDIAKAAAGSGGNAGCSGENLANIIEITYKKMVSIANDQG